MSLICAPSEFDILGPECYKAYLQFLQFGIEHGCFAELASRGFDVSGTVCRLERAEQEQLGACVGSSDRLTWYGRSRLGVGCDVEVVSGDVSSTVGGAGCGVASSSLVGCAVEEVDDGLGCVGVNGECGDQVRGDKPAGRDGKSSLESGSSGSGVEGLAGGVKENKKLERKAKNKRRKASKRSRKLVDGSGSEYSKGRVGLEDCGLVKGLDVGLSVNCGPVDRGNCGFGVSPVPSWRRGASSETVPVVSGLGGLREQGYFAEIAKEKRIELRESRADMLVRQNKLAMMRAEREMKVLEATDIDVEKRKYLTSVRAATERNMVSIEKTHARLVATDNVPRSALDHDVHTVLTEDVPGLSSGSISPNSSASMAEFRACQKENLDKQEKIDKMLAAFKKLGISETTIPFIGKKEWTVNSQGTVGCAAEEALDELMPGGFAIDGGPYVEKGDKVGIMSVGQWGF